MASAALELSAAGIDGLTTTETATTGAGRVAAGIVIIVGLVVFCYLGGGSVGSARTFLNSLIRSRVFMSQATAPFWSPYIVRGPWGPGTFSTE